MKPAIISQPARTAMMEARGTPGHRALVRQLFAEAKRHFSIPPKHRLRCELDDANHRHYLQLIRKKTGQPYMVDERLIPVYVTPVVEALPAPEPVALPAPTGYNFIRVPNAEAKAMLQCAAGNLGTLLTTKPAGKPTWHGTWAFGGNLIVPVGKKTYSIAVADAMAALILYGEQVTIPHSPDGLGGVLMDATALLIPA